MKTTFHRKRKENNDKDDQFPDFKKRCLLPPPLKGNIPDISDTSAEYIAKV